MIIGTTKIFAIIANPVSRVRTPEVLNATLAQAGINAAIIPIQISPGNLGTIMAAFRTMENLGGLIVSHPYKIAAAAFCDELSARAQAIGSVNAIRREADGRLIADMFDGMGFIAGLSSRGHDAKGRRALLAGAGDAATAVAFSLAEAQVASLTITSPECAKAQKIVACVSKSFPKLDIHCGGADPVGHELIINAASLDSWAQGPAPLDVAGLAPGMIAAETLSKPDDTPFLNAARAKGCTVHYGRYMLDSQLKLISDFIGATSAPQDHPQP